MKRVIFVSICFLIAVQSTIAQDKRYEEWYLKTKDTISIFVKEIKSASKDTVIVVHGGFGANHDYMLDAIKGLESKFYFILYDQRGSLLSPAPVSKLTFQANVNDLYELVDELKLKKVKLLCHSMGTLVAMEFASQHPEIISNIVLTGAILPNAKAISDVFSEQMGKNLEFLANRPEVKELKQYYIDKKASLTDKENTRFWRIGFAEGNVYNITKWNLLKGGQIYYNQQAAVMAETVNWDYDYRALLNNLNTTVIQGQYDFLDFNLSNYKAQITGYAKIRTKIIPNAGHNSWIDNPKLFRAYLLVALK